ncbi:MAG: YicC family protein [Lachnospiraceae bacterium]|nr:YicC family protein [Lachnospiraceae bacterium]
MVRSMTGFGRCEQNDGQRKITVEIKSVNHRFLDMMIKIPKRLNFFEANIRTMLKKYIQRGKVDVFILYEDSTENTNVLKYNQELAKEYWAYFEKMANQFRIVNNISIADLARFPEIFTMEEQGMDEESLWNLLERAVTEAAEKLVETRKTEGENLRRDMLAKLDGMLAHVDYIEERFPGLIAEYRLNLKNKVKELLDGAQVDDARILTEVTIYADKICVDEEVVRLKSHIQNVKAILQEQEGVGRKLDFMAQEMNREANTILSKSNDMEITNRAIELKTEIEKIREQIQNIE